MGVRGRAKRPSFSLDTPAWMSLKKLADLTRKPIWISRRASFGLFDSNDSTSETAYSEGQQNEDQKLHRRYFDDAPDEAVSSQDAQIIGNGLLFSRNKPRLLQLVDEKEQIDCWNKVYDAKVDHEICTNIELLK